MSPNQKHRKMLILMFPHFLLPAAQRKRMRNCKCTLDDMLTACQLNVQQAWSKFDLWKNHIFCSLRFSFRRSDNLPAVFLLFFSPCVNTTWQQKSVSAAATFSSLQGSYFHAVSLEVTLLPPTHPARVVTISGLSFATSYCPSVTFQMCPPSKPLPTPPTRLILAWQVSDLQPCVSSPAWIALGA